MLKSAIKSGLFLLIVGICILMLKMRSFERGNEQALAVRALTAADTSFFFIGSSRVQKSIDPAIINAHYNRFRVFNLGVSGGSFLSNCVMADFIIRQPGHKILFIELAPLLEELPDGVFTFSRQHGLSPSQAVLALTEKQSFPERSMLIMNTINHQVFKAVSVWREAREAIGYKTEPDVSLGYQPYDRNNSDGTASFLSWNEINGASAEPIGLERYQVMIGYLEGLAKRNNSRVVFFLPVTIPTKVERSIVIPLYHSISDTMKLGFPAPFLEHIAREEYLGDANHLNRQGANAFSGMLVPLLERFY